MHLTDPLNEFILRTFCFLPSWNCCWRDECPSGSSKGEHWISIDRLSDVEAGNLCNRTSPWKQDQRENTLKCTNHLINQLCSRMYDIDLNKIYPAFHRPSDKEYEEKKRITQNLAHDTNNHRTSRFGVTCGSWSTPSHTGASSSLLISCFYC